MKKQKFESYSLLANSSWPRCRANSGSTGKSSYSGPDGEEIIWETQIGNFSGEPAIDSDGNIYIPLKSEELVAISSDGKELWRKSFIGYSGKPLRGITTPSIREDGSLITAALRKIVCLEPTGEQRWEKTIDGLPSAPNIGPQGTIYVSAWSIDWAGMYVISPEGESIGCDDPKVKKSWRAGRFVSISPPSIDTEGNVYLSFRDNITHPEAYTWDPIDEVVEDYQYQCVVFDPEGNKLGRFYPHTRSFVYPTSVSINNKGCTHYVQASWPGLVCFTLDDILTDKAKHNKKFQWSWDIFRDEDDDGNEGPAFRHKAAGYIAILDENRVWFRTTKDLSSTNVIVQVDASEANTKDILNREVIRVSDKVDADPVIDCNDRLYIGTVKGKIHIIDSRGKELRTIDVGHPIISLVIGPDKSLVITTKDKHLCLIR